MRPSDCLFIAVLLLSGTATAQAQVTIHGRVIDDATEQPIAGASVALQNARGRVLDRQVSDELGRFQFSIVGNQPIRLQSSLIGYRNTTTPVFGFNEFRTFRLEVRMAADAIVLAPLEVIARYRFDVGPTLSGFEHRRVGGHGIFITREEIEQRRPNVVTDILATVPGISLQPSRAGNGRIVVMARSVTCPAQIFVDGFHMNREARSIAGRRGNTISTTDAFPIDDLLKPGTVYGIEVYQGASRVPPEFRTENAGCGVVAIWTRRTS